MYQKIVLPAEEIVVKKLPIQKGAAHNAEGHGFGAEFYRLHQVLIERSVFQGHRGSEAVGKGFPVLLRFKNPKAFVFPAFVPHGLEIRNSLETLRQKIAESGNGECILISQKIRKKKMEQQIIVRKAFGLPGGVEGIGGKLFAVHMDGHLFSTGGVIHMDISGQVALDPAAFIVVGAAAFLTQQKSDHKSVVEKLAQIIQDALKIFFKLLIVGHGTAFLVISKSKCDN